MRRKVFTEEEVYNYWLQKFHGVTIEELCEKYPDKMKSHHWFTDYPVTQEQHDEWKEWLIVKLMWFWGMSRKYVERKYGFIYLNCAPAVKE